MAQPSRASQVASFASFFCAEKKNSKFIPVVEEEHESTPSYLFSVV